MQIFAAVRQTQGVHVIAAYFRKIGQHILIYAWHVADELERELRPAI